MSNKSYLSQIPKNWQNLIKQSEFDKEINQVTAELMSLAGSRLNLEKSSQEDIIQACSKAWKTSIFEVRHSLQAMAKMRATTRLFTRYYGHLFSKDENGELILTPEENEQIYFQ